MRRTVVAGWDAGTPPTIMRMIRILGVRWPKHKNVMCKMTSPKAEPVE